jgi:hypothetical protein
MPSRRDVLAGAGSLAALGTLPSPATAAGPSRTWVRRYRPADRETARLRDVVVLRDGIALVGLAGAVDRSRGWVSVADPGGRPRWHHAGGTARSAFLAGTPAVDGAGGVVVAGLTNGVSDPLAPQHTDPYVVRAGADGAVSWARSYQPAAPSGGASAVTGGDGGYVLAGSANLESHERPWAARIDADGTRTWAWRGDRAGDVNDAVGVPGGVVVAGSTWPPGSDVPDPRGRLEGAWAARLGPGGDVAWEWRADRRRGDRVEALAPRPDGGVVAVGRRGFATDDRGVGWLVALDADGRPRWERTYPQDAWNWHSDVAGHADGYALVGTREEGPDTDDRGAWLLAVDADGRPRWEHQAETGTRGATVAGLPDGGLLVGGETHAGSGRRSEAWLAKFGGDPAPARWVGGVPALPGWTAPFLAGGVAGAVGVGAAAYWRQSRA